MGELATDPMVANIIRHNPHRRAIDLAFLARQTMGNKALESDILQLYRTQLRKFEPDWHKAKALPNLVINLHSMRSAALGVGAVSIAELSKAAEVDLRENGGHIADIYTQLAKTVAETLHFIDDILGH
ncbi:hypothetical protein [Maritalea mediterranea]|uniref:Hpt domain-containing protein n=1 Tax=Maritalea mediterranea TaxID=2909667 RepID=A0ABS9E7N3_9HYPH|nr:hypothetical protein [Maritalea mediterranea]MCF4098852.1 hypothetical protein [Maritalea mediterranea]